MKVSFGYSVDIWWFCFCSLRQRIISEMIRKPPKQPKNTSIRNGWDEALEKQPPSPSSIFFYKHQSQAMQADVIDHSIQIFKLKKLFHRLETARIAGSVVSIVIPPRKIISDVTKMLSDEISRAVQIKCKRNRMSVIEALGSAKERLKLYNRAPENGLVVFTGKIMDENSTSERKLICDFEPYKPINFSIYNCGHNFYLDPLKKELLVNQPPFGFIVVDGNGVLFATLQGNAKVSLKKITVQLPNRHNNGGQSSVRFARLREEKRHNYLRKVCETATQIFLTDNRCNVTGLVLAGSADFKNDLNKTEMFDPRLQAKVVNIVDVSEGFENGLNQAIDKSTKVLANTKLMQEKELLSKFFDHIAIGDGMVTYGVQDTMTLIESGAVGKIICMEDLDYARIQVRNTITDSISCLYVKTDQVNDPDLFRDRQTGAILQRLYQEDQPTSLTQWLAIHYPDYGCEVQFVTDNSPEGTQFLKGFSGLGGFLRYKIMTEDYLSETQEYEEMEEEFL